METCDLKESLLVEISASAIPAYSEEKLEVASETPLRPSQFSNDGVVTHRHIQWIFGVLSCQLFFCGGLIQALLASPQFLALLPSDGKVPYFAVGSSITIIIFILLTGTTCGHKSPHNCRLLAALTISGAVFLAAICAQFDIEDFDSSQIRALAMPPLFGAGFLGHTALLSYICKCKGSMDVKPCLFASHAASTFLWTIMLPLGAFGDLDVGVSLACVIFTNFVVIDVFLVAANEPESLYDFSATLFMDAVTWTMISWAILQGLSAFVAEEQVAAFCWAYSLLMLNGILFLFSLYKTGDAREVLATARSGVGSAALEMDDSHGPSPEPYECVVV